MGLRLCPWEAEWDMAVGGGCKSAGNHGTACARIALACQPFTWRYFHLFWHVFVLRAAERSTCKPRQPWMYQKPPQKSLKPREAQEERGFGILAAGSGQLRRSTGQRRGLGLPGAGGGTWSWIWDRESKSHDSIERPLVLLSSCLKGCQELGLVDSARTELELFGVFS